VRENPPPGFGDYRMLCSDPANSIVPRAITAIRKDAVSFLVRQSASAFIRLKLARQERRRPQFDRITDGFDGADLCPMDAPLFLMRAISGPAPILNGNRGGCCYRSASLPMEGRLHALPQAQRRPFD